MAASRHDLPHPAMHMTSSFKEFAINLLLVLLPTLTIATIVHDFVSVPVASPELHQQ